MKATFVCRWILVAVIVGVSIRAYGADRESEAKPFRILFVGNSYTAQSWGAIKDVFEGHQVERQVKGGAKLSGWDQDEGLAAKIREGEWDFVVLQEQSQVPSLGGQHVEQFQKAAAALDAKIKAGKAKTVLFMTWGRRDGDARNQAINPTFEKMQARLSASYREAATKLGAKVAPVGEVFALLKQEQPDLFPKLYKKDGSHPASPGGYAAAYTLHATIVGEVPIMHAKTKGGDVFLVAAAVQKLLSK